MTLISMQALVRDTARFCGAPPAWPLPRIVLRLDERSRAWVDETRDVEHGLGDYLGPRMRLVRRWWDAAASIARQGQTLAENTILEVARGFFDLVRAEYESMSAKLVAPPTAQGLRDMTAVQRSLYYTAWVTVIAMQGVVARLAAALRGEVPVDRLPAYELRYLSVMGEARRPLLGSYVHLS